MPSILGTVVLIDLRIPTENIILPGPVFTSRSDFSIPQLTMEVGQVVAGRRASYAVLDSTYDGQFFFIDRVSGYLAFNVLPYIDTPYDENQDNVYNIVVRATLNGQEATQEITVTVTK